MKTNSIRLLTAMLCLLIAGLGAAGCDDDKDNTDSGVVTKDTGVDTVVADGKVPDQTPKPDAKPSKITSELVILHTNDLHSHLMGHGPNADYSPATTGDDTTLGGYARLAAQVKAERTAAGTTPLLLLDGGDFLMGTAFPMLGTTKSVEMIEMGLMGYDAIVLGNHEFDWTPSALAGFIKAAVTGGFKVPLLATNMKFDATKTEDDTLAALETSGAIKRTFVKTLSNGVKVGFFGILGKGAVSVAPNAAPVTFEAAATSAKAAIKQLRTTDKVDLVIAISHSGTDTAGKGDDADMAAAAPGIDVIISGHTHSALTKPFLVGSTWIVQTGSYGRALGKLILNLHENKTTSVKSYKLIPIDDTIKGDAATQTRIVDYIKDLDAILVGSGMSYRKVIAETTADLTLPDYQEALLGNLVTDSYIGVISKLQPSDPPVIAVESPGVMRDEVYKGKTGQLWFADLYRALPLGIGLDKQPGYPLLTIHLNGTEIKTVAEVTALAKTFGNNDYFLSLSGLQMEYDDSKLIFGKVTSLKDSAGKAIEITSTTKCYKVAANYYIYMLMGLLKNMGAPPIIPKKSDCKTAITDIKAHFVDADPTKTGIQELKPYQALIQYMSAFTDTDNDKIPDVPSEYTKLDPTKPRIKKL